MACKYCDNTKSLYSLEAVLIEVNSQKRTLEIWEFPNGYRRHIASVPVVRCPMCGEKLGDAE